VNDGRELDGFGARAEKHEHSSSPLCGLSRIYTIILRDCGVQHNCSNFGFFGKFRTQYTLKQPIITYFLYFADFY